MRSYNLLRNLFIILFLFSLHYHIEASNKNVIAIVEKIEIKADDLMISTDDLIPQLLLQGKIIDDKTISNEMIRYKKLKLASLIKKIILEKKCKEYGITITNKEIMEYKRKFFEGVDLEKSVEKIKKDMLKLIEALKLVLNLPQKEQEIYEKNFKKDMTYQQWLGLIKFFNSEAKIDKYLIKEIPYSKEDLLEPDLASKSALIWEKLKEKVTKDIKTKDEEIKKWFSEEIEKSNIKILDPKFSDVVLELLKNP